jgi:hypothetical protein
MKFHFCGALLYDLKDDLYELHLRGIALPALNIVMLQVPADIHALEELQDEAMRAYLMNPIRVSRGGGFRAEQQFFQLRTKRRYSTYSIEVEVAARYAIFTANSFAEFRAALYGPSGMVELQEIRIFRSAA